MARKLSKSEWVSVLNRMEFYNRSEGFVNDVDGVLTFFDGNACIDGVYSFFVTINDVKNFIKNYESN